MSEEPYQILRTAAVDRSLARLPRPVQGRLAAAMRALAAEPCPRGCLPVKSRPGCLRIRVGDWRILYRVDDQSRTVLVIEIMPRQDDYRP